MNSPRKLVADEVVEEALRARLQWSLGEFTEEMFSVVLLTFVSTLQWSLGEFTEEIDSDDLPF